MAAKGRKERMLNFMIAQGNGTSGWSGLEDSSDGRGDWLRTVLDLNCFRVRGVSDEYTFGAGFIG